MNEVPSNLKDVIEYVCPPRNRSVFVSYIALDYDTPVKRFGDLGVQDFLYSTYNCCTVVSEGWRRVLVILQWPAPYSRCLSLLDMPISTTNLKYVVYFSL